MKILKLITGLLLTVSCFFVNAQTAICDTGVNNTGKIRPVFINGMRNQINEAEASADLFESKLVELYGRENVLPVYYAYNDKEFFLFEGLEVVYQFFLDMLFSDEYEYDENAIEKMILAFKNFNYSIIDSDAKNHKTKIKEYIDNGEQIMFIAHSQGNLYFNALYDQYLKYNLDKFRVVSVGSPVSLNAPSTHASMVVESYDFIKIFNGLGPFYNKDRGYLSNATNTKPYKGHSFENYILGNETGSMLSDLYLNYYEDLTGEVKSGLTIDINSSSSNIEYAISEIHIDDHYEYRNIKHSDFKLETTDEDSKLNYFGLNGNEIKGMGYKYGNIYSYTIDCYWLLRSEEVRLSLMAWNKDNTPVALSMSYSGVVKTLELETLEPSSINEEYRNIGYDLVIKKTSNDTVESWIEDTSPRDREIKIEIINDNVDFDLYVKGLYSNDKSYPDLELINTCLSSNNECLDEYEKDEDGRYWSDPGFGRIEKTSNGYIYYLNRSDIPYGFNGPSIEFYARYKGDQKEFFEITAEMPKFTQHTYNSLANYEYEPYQSKRVYKDIGFLYFYEPTQYYYFSFNEHE